MSINLARDGRSETVSAVTLAVKVTALAEAPRG